MRHVITDLSQLVLCPFQIIQDIISQLTSAAPALEHLLFKPVCPLSSPTDWVNVDDSLGDLAPLRAFELNRLCNGYLQQADIHQLKIHVYLGDKPLTIDNFYALLFLSESLEALDIIFYIQPEKINEMAFWMSDFSIKRHVGVYYHHASMFKQKEHHELVLTKLSFKRQAILTAQGFNFCLETSEKVDVSHLGAFIQYIWTTLKAGAYSLGCQLFETLLAKADLARQVREELFVHLQVVRFLSHQHELVVAAHFPDTFCFIGEERITYLYFIRAFSATLTRQLDKARDYFEKACIDGNMPIENEDTLYKLNLFALFHFLNGHTDLAFQIENRLLTYIKSHPTTATALMHVVLINHARLNKKINQFDEAKRYYQKAYEQLSGGGFTLFDYMSYEMDKAILSEACQQPRHALYSWLKVAMYWLSCPNPYALALRPRLVLCQEKVVDTLMPLSREKVSRFLLAKLNKLMVLADIDCMDISTKVLDILPSDTDLTSASGKNCYVVEEMIVYGYETAQLKRKLVLTATEAGLNRVVSNLLQALLAIPPHLQAVAIDTNHDLFYPESQQQCAAFAVITECQRCYFNKAEINLTPFLAKDYRLPLQMKLSPMIKSIEVISEGLDLHYKRGFLNQRIKFSSAVDFISKLQQQEQAGIQVVLSDTDKGMLTELIAKKVVSLAGNDDVCSAC